MADTKISQMPLALTLTGAEIAPLVQSGVNVQTSLTTIVNETIQAGPSTVRTSLGLGSMAVQNSNNVSITGGSVAASTLTGTVSIANGGTGQNNRNDAINALLPAQTTNHTFLQSNGTDASWDTINISTDDVTGTLPVTKGGTGATTLTGYVKGNGTSAFTATTTIPNTDISGLGTMSTQNANNVAITGGTISSVAIDASSIDNTTIGATTPGRVNTSLFRTTALTGYLYGNGSSNDVTSSTTIPWTDITGAPALLSLAYGYFYQDGNTTLTNAISNNSTAPIIVGSTADFPTSGWIVIGTEIISYTGKTSISFTGIARGVLGSTNVSHDAGSLVSEAQGPGSSTSIATLELNNIVYNNDVTIDGSNISKMVFNKAGTYNVQFSAQLLNYTTSDDNVTIWYRKNGIDVPYSAGVIQVPPKHGQAPGATISSWNYFETFAIGDYFQLCMASLTGNTIASTYPAGTSPVSPVSPALILSAVQIG